MRRGFLWRLLGLGGTAVPAQAAAAKGKVLIKSAWGSADPTQASFPYLAGKNATFASPTVFVSLVHWADKVLAE